ncbi:MAG: SpoIIE family protein phosphatase [Spirochaetales bacterium]|nr:SpoIIE family protein phosphatase [Spirochaetales bacterium]
METQSIKILLVEDNLGDARLIREALSETEKLDPTIEHVTRMKDLEKCVSRTKYDLIILDLTLPDAAGIGTVRRASEIASESAIIVLTGINDENLAVKAVQEGAQDYLVKGQADVRVLERVILYALERNLARIRISVLRDELKKALMEIDEELEISASIQRKIIEQEIPQYWKNKVSIYYAFAQKIGGDLYDIIKLDDKNTVFVIADGSGHSVHAAFLSIMFKLALKHQIPRADGPKELIENINKELQPFFLNNMFFTTFTAWVNMDKMILTYSAAGHPCQYLVSPKKKTLTRLKNKGIPLCINIDTSYEQSVVEIEHGDRLVLFTDGIFECFNDCGEKFGEERLRKLLENNMDLKPEELKQKIVKKVESYNGEIIRGSAGLIDDSVFIVAEL